MSTDQKVALVHSVRDQCGVTVALRVLGLARSTWHYHQAHRRSYAEKYQHLRGFLEAIARSHTAYGYRRTTTELQETYGQWVNHKVVQRLHRLWDLPLLRGTQPPRPSGIRRAITAAGDRANLVRSLERIDPFAVVYTDFTEVPYAFGKAHLIVLIDHHTKLVLGWAVGPRKETRLALAAWRRARAMLKRLGRSPQGIIVHHDQDPVFTGTGWTARLLLTDGARLSYALNGAKDNPEMESFFSRFKTENRSLFGDAHDGRALAGVIGRRIRYHNTQRRHSTLGNRAPRDYAESRTTNPGSQ